MSSIWVFRRGAHGPWWVDLHETRLFRSLRAPKAPDSVHDADLGFRTRSDAVGGVFARLFRRFLEPG